VKRNDNYDAAAILADCRAGLPYRGIAERQGVSIQTVSKIAIANGLRRGRPEDRGSCARCGQPCYSATCRDCRYSNRAPDPADGLPEGDWVLCRRTRVVRFEVA
jgi:hypothetical protein